jgi:hypothetical protein
VLAIDHPLFGHSRRGILVQAKRLFGRGKKREFGLFSDYSSFDKTQAEFLKTLQERFEVWNSVYYLWYNPPSVAFADADAKILRAYEANGSNLHQFRGRIHPFVDDLIDMGFPAIFGAGTPRLAPSEDEESKAREWRTTQPALRISALDVVLSLGDHGPPHLKALYDAALDRRWSSLTFSPFADFFLLALSSSRYGSENADWLKLTEGHKVPMPPRKQASDEHTRSQLDEFENPPIPHHTLKLTIRSTLPSVG